MDNDNPVQMIADAVGGKVESMTLLPDGHGFATVSFPLPKDHWLTKDDGTFEPPPMVMRIGTEEVFSPAGLFDVNKLPHAVDRNTMADIVKKAARYAVRASTMNGKESDFDPDAMVQNFITGMLGYYTPNGLSNDDFANPK